MKDYVHVKRLSENVYYLNKKGREMIGSDQKTLSVTAQIEHILMRNELRIYLKPKGCQIEQPIKNSKGEILIKPDALFQFNQWVFVEIDNTQKMIENKRKIERYGKIQKSNILKHAMGYFPQLIFLTQSEYRKARLSQTCKENNLQHKIYLINDIK